MEKEQLVDLSEVEIDNSLNKVERIHSFIEKVGKNVMFDRKCGNCYSFPCMREECSRDNVCESHKFEHEVIIEELEVNQGE